MSSQRHKTTVRKIIFKLNNKKSISIKTPFKLRNIFIKNNKIKIGDFGISKFLIGTKNTKSDIGTEVYWPPEIHKGEKYGFKADIW